VTLAKILVPVRGSGRDGAALRTAFAAARPFLAHVEALFVHSDPRETIPYVGVPLSPQVIQDVIDSATELNKAASAAAREIFARQAKEAQARIVAVAEKSTMATASWVEKTGHLTSVLEQAALLADLIVFPPVGHGDNPDVHDALIRVLTKSGRPILLSPDEPGEELGRRVVVGWDGGMAAAHALSAALPFFGKAESVTILSFARTKESSIAPEAARAYLALHGVSAELHTADRGTHLVGELLTATAGTMNADLLVVGGYGHSHALQTIFGGVTQHIVSQPKLPVFMMH